MTKPLEITSQNEATYESLISLIENNQDRLALILVACDDLRLRRRVIDRYEAEAREARIRPLRIVLGTEPSLRAGLAKLGLRQGQAAVVTVTGAEWLLRVKMREEEDQSDLDKFFGYLQWTREGLREFRYPIVLWVTAQILREMSRRAPDFWSWRKAVLRFASEEAESIAVREGERQTESPQPQLNEEFLPPLEELLSEIQQLETTSPKSANLATLYDKLGQVYANRIARGEATHLEQERQQANDAFQNAIYRYQVLNNQPDLVDVLQRFGNFLLAQSCYKEAITAYQQSLEMAREIGDRHGAACSLHSLGNAYKSLGQYDRAIELYQQSLEVFREVGNRHYEANALATKALSLAKYESRRFEALDTLQQARAIFIELKLDHKVERCDEDIYAFNQIIATEQRQFTPAIPPKLKSRPTKKRQIKWFLWFCVGVAIVLLIAWLRK